MITLLSFIFTCMATVFGVCQSSIPFLPGVRRWLAIRSSIFAEFITCAWCVGFWAGLAWSFVFKLDLGLIDSLMTPDYPIVYHIVAGLVASAACGIIDSD